ncbi:type III-A CRISPR-associated protein Csm2 [Liquorilactobacillus nagelii]|jgi:CRISPR-associated protein Csm2|uniref:type III-A CRISPR-associated protein Csm2 n=1 Tax=Liquorilactobacillus nagelii TaxID=82688 RepID=UPI0039EAEE3A
MYRSNNNSYHKNKFEENWKEIPISFAENSYVQEAENVILEMKSKNFRCDREELTNSQLRNLLSLTSTIYDEVLSQGFESITDRLAYLRIQFVYQSGRNKAVKKLVELADILNILAEVQDRKNKDLLVRFCHYMEALVAYFKFYGGKE